MYLRRTRKTFASLALMMIASLVVLTGVAAQIAQYPTYHYYGQILSVDEFLKLVEEGTPLGCTPLPSVGTYLGTPGAALDIICFNTDEELTSYIAEVLDPQWEQIIQESPTPQSLFLDDAQTSNKALLSSNHWALYANSYYTAPHLGNVHNGSGCYATSGVWSAWRDGSPNNLSLFRFNNCISNPYYTFSAPVASCGLAWPLYCGGSQGASVP